MEWIRYAMMVAFVLALALSLWKLYAFIPSKPLADDDTTSASVAVLEQIMIECEASHPNRSEEELLAAMMEHPLFDQDHFWRFNLNRLRHLIVHYRFRDPSFRPLDTLAC